MGAPSARYSPADEAFYLCAGSVYCTVSPVEPFVPPEFAPIAVAPTPRHWARPAILGAFAMVATLADDELQWLFREMSCEVPSLKVPCAENC